MSVAPMALNQNGDTSRSDPSRRSASGIDASSVQYGAHASSGMSGFGGGGGGSRVAISTPPMATTDDEEREDGEAEPLTGLAGGRLAGAASRSVLVRPWSGQAACRGRACQRSRRRAEVR